jgi:hypothetical protein
MAVRARDSGVLLCTLTAAAAVAAVCWLTLREPGWLDYGVEARPAVAALVAGHISRFLALAPSYGGSLLLRAPVFLIARAAGADASWLYRASTMVCLLAVAGLGLWLASELRSRGQTLLTQVIAVGVCVANPMVLEAVRWGHPEEILGAVLCVFAVVAALRRRSAGAGLLLGLAIANKQWALVAIGPVLVALPERRWRAAGWAAATCAILLAPFELAAATAGHFSAGVSSGAIFHRWQVWWFFGNAGTHLAAHPLAIGYRSAPSWLSAVAHPLIVAVGLGLSGAFVLARNRIRESGWLGRPWGADQRAQPWGTDPRAQPSGADQREQPWGADPLLLLAIVLLARCALDPWDMSYYALPFLLALASWETLGEGRTPVAAVAASLAAWFAFQEMPKPEFGLSTDAQAAIFIALVAVTEGAMWVRLCRPPVFGLRQRHGDGHGEDLRVSPA